MPKRRVLRFTEKDVSHVSLVKPVNVGKTSSLRYIEEVKQNFSGEIDSRFFFAKIHFRKGSMGKGKGKAQRVLLKPVLGASRESQYKTAKKQAEIMEKMRSSGLPVPKAGAIMHGEQAYLAVEPFLRHGKSVLVPINPSHGNSRPKFLKKLSVEKHAHLIRGMAKDLATMANLGISTEFFDFHAFYKRKDGSLKRVIVDTNNLTKGKFLPQEVKGVAHEIKKVWKGKKYAAEKKLFLETLLKNIRDRETRERFRVAFAEKSRIQLLRAKIGI